MIELALSWRADDDLDAIEAYSRKHWGNVTAEQYINDIYAAIDRLHKNPDLFLADKSDISQSLKFYRVNSHYLICDYREDVILILTIQHARSDLARMLETYEPLLFKEADILHRQLAHAKVKRK